MRAFVRDLAESRPDVVFVSAYLHDAIVMRREMVRQGLDVLVGIGTSSSYCMPRFGSTLGEDAVGLFASDKPASNALNVEGLTPDGRALLQRATAAYAERFGGPMSAAALAGFSGAWALLHEVLSGAGDPTPAAVASAANVVDLPEGSLPNGRPAVRRARYGDRGRERAREQRGVAVAGAGRVRGRLAASVRDQPDRAARSAAVRVRSRALGAGVAIALVYRDRRALRSPQPARTPALLDGLAPPTAYRWVQPPPSSRPRTRSPPPAGSS